MFSLSNTAIKSSRILLFFFSGMHLAALASVLFVELPSLVAPLGILFLLLSFSWLYPLYISLTDRFSIVRIYWDVNLESLRLQQLNGEWLDVELIKQQTVLPFAVFLQLHVEQRYLPVFVLLGRDSCNKQDFRRFRVNCMLLGGKYFNAKKSSQE